MSSTLIPSMIIENIELRTRAGIAEAVDPTTCEHTWEPHLWEIGRVHCPRCGSFARWANDPRLEETA